MYSWEDASLFNADDPASYDCSFLNLHAPKARPRPKSRVEPFDADDVFKGLSQFMVSDGPSPPSSRRRAKPPVRAQPHKSLWPWGDPDERSEVVMFSGFEEPLREAPAPLPRQPRQSPQPRQPPQPWQPVEDRATAEEGVYSFMQGLYGGGWYDAEERTQAAVPALPASLAPSTDASLPKLRRSPEEEGYYLNGMPEEEERAPPPRQAAVAPRTTRTPAAVPARRIPLPPRLPSPADVPVDLSHSRSPEFPIPLELESPVFVPPPRKTQAVHPKPPKPPKPAKPSKQKRPIRITMTDDGTLVRESTDNDEPPPCTVIAICPPDPNGSLVGVSQQRLPRAIVFHVPVDEQGRPKVPPDFITGVTEALLEGDETGQRQRRQLSDNGRLECSDVSLQLGESDSHRADSAARRRPTAPPPPPPMSISVPRPTWATTVVATKNGYVVFSDRPSARRRQADQPAISDSDAKAISHYSAHAMAALRRGMQRKRVEPQAKPQMPSEPPVALVRFPKDHHRRHPVMASPSDKVPWKRSARREYRRDSPRDRSLRGTKRSVSPLPRQRDGRTSPASADSPPPPSLDTMTPGTPPSKDHNPVFPRFTTHNQREHSGVQRVPETAGAASESCGRLSHGLSTAKPSPEMARQMLAAPQQHQPAGAVRATPGTLPPMASRSSFPYRSVPTPDQSEDRDCETVMNRLFPARDERTGGGVLRYTQPGGWHTCATTQQ